MARERWRRGLLNVKMSGSLGFWAAANLRNAARQEVLNACEEIRVSLNNRLEETAPLPIAGKRYAFGITVTGGSVTWL